MIRHHGTSLRQTLRRKQSRESLFDNQDLSHAPCPLLLALKGTAKYYVPALSTLLGYPRQSQLGWANTVGDRVNKVEPRDCAVRRLEHDLTFLRIARCDVERPDVD